MVTERLRVIAAYTFRSSRVAGAAGRIEGHGAHAVVAHLLPCLLLLLLLLPPLATAGEYAEVTVSEPLMELRTGPGRAYPVFHVVERGQSVQILKQRTDWFKVRTVRGKEGWVDRAQMERAVMAEGVQQDLREAVLADFQRKRWEGGFGAGFFEGDSSVALRAGYLLTPNLIAELGYSRISGAFSGSQLYGISLQLQPDSRRRYVPFFALGVGRFENRNRASLIGETGTLSATVASAGIGLRVYLTRNFLLRADYRQHLSLTSEQDNDRFDEALLGFSFFF